MIDCAHGGLGIAHGATVPTRAHIGVLEPGVAHGEIVVECDDGERGAALVRQALQRPKRRRRTRVPRAVKERRLEQKKRRSEVKRRRRKPRDD